MTKTKKQTERSPANQELLRSLLGFVKAYTEDPDSSATQRAAQRARTRVAGTIPGRVRRKCQ